jgi:3-hydroxyisobutyrate dehydrogenase
VWNRTAEAVRGALRIHLVLSDDEAVEAVLAAAQPPPGTWIFDHSTTSTAGVKARSAAPTARPRRCEGGPKNDETRPDC